MGMMADGRKYFDVAYDIKPGNEMKYGGSARQPYTFAATKAAAIRKIKKEHPDAINVRVIEDTGRDIPYSEMMGFPSYGPKKPAKRYRRSKVRSTR